MIIFGGIIRIFVAWSDKSKWPPLTEIINFKKITIVYLSNFLILGSIIVYPLSADFFFHSKIYFATPWTLLPGAVSPLVLAHPPHNYTTDCNKYLNISKEQYAFENKFNNAKNIPF